MELMINGTLVTCTPKEYVELQQLGAIPSPPATNGTNSAPQYTPLQVLERKLPDDIVPLPERGIQLTPQPYDDFLHNNSVVPLYGCVIDTSNMPVTLQQTDTSSHITSDTNFSSTATSGSEPPKNQYYVLRSKDEMKYWSMSPDEYTTPNMANAHLYTSIDEANRMLDYLKTREFGEFIVAPYEGTL